VKQTLQYSETRKFEKILAEIDINRMAADSIAFKQGFESISRKYGESTAIAFGALIASGVNDKAGLLRSAKEIDKLFRTVVIKLMKNLCNGEDIPLSRVQFANLIFKTLASIKTNRYTLDYVPFPQTLERFNDGNPMMSVGNCISITIPDNITLSKFGFRPSAATDEETIYGATHHVHTRIKINGAVFDLDNIYNYSRLTAEDRSKKEIGNIKLIAMIYSRRGKEAENSGDFETARAFYTKSLELFPDYLSAYECRAYVNIRLGDYNGAIRDASSALKLNPERYTSFNTRGAARYQRAMQLREQGKRKEANRLLRLALEDLNEAIYIEPNYSLAYSNRAAVNWALGMDAEADDDWETANKLRFR
jgi:tetratricopeptide (TPR) repeat protein